jgi:hypothetical protein
MMRKYSVVLAVSAALAVAAFAAPGSVQKSSTITVGDFAVRVTKAIGRPVASPSAAVDSLKTLGVKIGDANASLTEGLASRILADLGVRVTTSNPNSVVTQGKADQLAFVAGLASTRSSTTPASDLPGDCLKLANRGQCDTCCTTALGCDVDFTPCNGGVCAKFCHQVLPPGQVSPGEPEP